MTLDLRLMGSSGWALIAGGVLYWLFYSSEVGGFELGDDYWMLTLSIHALTIVAIVVGLVGGHSAFAVRGWASRLWWVSTAFAFLGLTVGNPLFSVAVFGLAVLAFARLHAPVVALLLAVGGGLWLYLFILGVRVGDQNAQPPTGSEELMGIAATTLMSLGLIGLGVLAIGSTSGQESKSATSA